MREALDESITYHVHSCAHCTLLNTDINTAPPPDSHTFRHFDMESLHTPRSLRERKNVIIIKEITRIDCSRCVKLVNLPPLSISQ